MKISTGRIEYDLQHYFARISLGWRLTLAIVVLFVPLCIFGISYVAMKSEAIRTVHFKNYAIELLGPLGDVIGLLANRRGMLNLEVLGDESARTKMSRTDDAIDRCFMQFEATYQRFGDMLNTREKLAAINSGLAALKSEGRNVLPAESYARHTALIREAVSLSDSVAEAAIIRGMRPEIYYLINALFIHNTDFRVSLAELRDEIVVLARTSAPKEANRIAIMNRIAGISGRIEDIESAFAKAYGYAPGLKARIEPLVKSVKSTLFRFIAHAERQSEGVNQLTAAQVFALGEEVLEQYKSVNDTISSILLSMQDDLIADLKRAERVAISVVVGAALLALLVSILSVRSVSRPVAHLISVVDLLARGHEDTRAGLDSPDAIGVLARELDKLMDERKCSEDKLTYLAKFDSLTGLPNRHMLHDYLVNALAQAKLPVRPVACMFIDLDRFKAINDTYGHHIGDLLLIQVSARLKQCVRGADIVGRLGGDEFAVLLSSLTKPEDADVVAQKIVDSLSNPFDLDGRPSYVTASVGIAVYPKDGIEVNELLKNADIAMYLAKQQGRSQFQSYSPQMGEVATERMQLESLLRGALERNEFLLHYQPKVNLATGKMSGFEALLRWQQPQQGLVSPAVFIPILEDAGMISNVGEWVLQTVCRQIKDWHAKEVDPMSVAINLSARQFQQADFTERVRNILDQHRIDHGSIQFEITESMLMDDPEAAAQIMRDLKGIGVMLAVDDFGTGYSSLAYLQRFPLDELKIDQSFVREVTTDPNNAAIIKAIIDLAHNLKLKVVAEGVESKAQLSFLRSHGCDGMQGYYFARPMTIDDCTRALVEDRRLELGPDDESSAVPVVLIVDDNELDLDLVRRKLEPDGYRILVTSDPRKALEMMMEHCADIVISDHNMPRISGVEFMVNVRNLFPRAVRIVMSGESSIDMVTDAVNAAGIHKYLSKNWDAERLRQEVREAHLRGTNRAKSS